MALGFDEKEIQKESLISLPHSRIRITDTNKNDFKLHAFCLMPNHFHLLIEQCSDISLSTLMKKVCTSFAMYMNKKYKRVGYLFQDRFKSTLIESNPQLMWTSSYIHMNPVKDGLVKNPEDYKWSSYNDFTEERNLPITYKKLLISTFGNKNNFIKETLNFDVKGAL